MFFSRHNSGLLKGYQESYGHYARSNQFAFKSLSIEISEYSLPIRLILVNTSNYDLQPFHCGKVSNVLSRNMDFKNSRFVGTLKNLKVLNIFLAVMNNLNRDLQDPNFYRKLGTLVMRGRATFTKRLPFLFSFFFFLVCTIIILHFPSV